MHSDVGGGYPEKESGLAKISLEWMLCEAASAGLMLDRGKVADVLGYAGGNYVPPNEAAQIHKSLNDAWMLLEPLPHRYYDMSTRPPRTRIRIPFGRRRYVQPGVTVHQSVEQRIAEKIDGYNPPNLPQERRVEPWVRWKESKFSAAV